MKWFLGSTAILGTAAVVVVSNIGFDSNVIKSGSDSGNLTPNVVTEKGTPEVQPVLPEYVVTEKGTPEVQPVLPEYVVTEKGTPEVQPVLPEYVVSEKGTPEVQPVLPEYVVSEKGTPEVQPVLPEYVVSEKGIPEVQPVLPEYVITHKQRTDVKPILPARVHMDDIRLNEGETRISYPGENGSLTTVYDDYIGMNGEILKSDKLSESKVEPVVKVVRHGVKKPNETIGETGMYRLSEHTLDMDIVKFNQNINLTSDEIKALGQDEIDRRAASDVENNLWLAGKPGWYVIANAPLSDLTIDKLNTNDYVRHKFIGAEVLKLVNEERKRLGKTELKWSDGLYELSKLRATELGLNGNIRFWNDQGEMLKHVRDSKGTKWYEVARGTNFAPRALGENLAGFTLPRNVYKVFSEKFIAKQLYEQWRNSPGHYANMIDDEYTEFGFDLAYSKFWRNDGKSIDYLAQGIQGVQLFAV